MKENFARTHIPAEASSSAAALTAPKPLQHTSSWGNTSVKIYAFEQSAKIVEIAVKDIESDVLHNFVREIHKIIECGLTVMEI